MNVRPPLTTSLATAGLVAVAALPLADVFDGWSWAVAVMGAAVAGAVAAAAIETTVPKLSPTIVALTTVAGSLVWALTVSLREFFWSDPISRTLRRELGEGVFSGWGAMLEEQFPLTDPQSAETFAALLTWIAAAAGVHVAARTRTAFAAIGAGAAVLWVATTAALPRGLTPAIFGAGAGAVALVAIATTTRSRAEGRRAGRMVAVLFVVVGAATVAIIATDLADRIDRDPLDPRAARDTETVTQQVPDLLARFSVARESDEVAMTLDGPPIDSPLRLRLQVYDSHDGERWLPATGFEEVATFPTPAILPPGDIVTYDVDLEALPGPWIPLPDRLVGIDVSDIRWNEETQTALETRFVNTYRFTGTSVSRSGLGGLEADRAAVSGPAGEVPARLPAEIRAEAESAAAGTTDALTTIDAITARVRELGRDENVAPGHSFGRLRRDLVDGRAGGAEQLASLHALMLRAVGIPSRLVVGYLATGDVVHADDLHVWTEVALPGVGWVASDPVPPVSDTTREGTADDDPTTPTTEPLGNTALEAQALPQELGPGDDPDEVDVGGRDDITVRDAFLYAAVAAGLIMLSVVVIRVARRQFRHATNRRAETRILGAWAEFVDRLRELGAPITATTTIGDVVYMARTIDDQLGDEAAFLGELAAEALHGPDEPDFDRATLAWEELRRIESTLAATKGGYTIALRYLDPRVLRHRAPKPPAHREVDRRRRGPDRVS